MSVGPVSPADRVRGGSPCPPATIPPGLVTVPLTLITRTGVRFSEPGASTYCCQSGDAGHEGSGPLIVAAAPAAAGVTSSAAAATTLAPAASAAAVRGQASGLAPGIRHAPRVLSDRPGQSVASRGSGGRDVADTGHITA